MIAVICAAAAIGCGKKGPPLAPIVHVPSQIDKIAARRVGSDVYVTLTVPATNIDMSMPADVSRIEVFGYTGLTPPTRARWAALGRMVGEIPVVPAPQPDAVVPPPPPDPNAGVVQGTSVTIIDTLSEDELVQGRIDPPLVLPRRRAAAAPVAAPAPVVPLVPPPMRRFYLAIPFSPRGRAGPPGTAAELTLTDIPEPPQNMKVAYDPATVSIAWEPSGGLLGFLLDRELTMEPPPFDDTPAVTAATVSPAPPGSAAPHAPRGPTTYSVYVEAAPDPLTLPGPLLKPVPWRAALPAPATPTPIAVLAFSEPVEFERERCYSVRATRGGIESDPSARTCFRAVDVYPPPPPAALEAVAAEGGISLIWEPSNAPDLGGYLVLRGEPGDATLHPLTPAPIFEASYRDTTVIPGRRYVYAVVALDNRVPIGNSSSPSPTVTETAK